MTLSGAFAAAAAVRRRPQHLVSHSARPGLQGLLLLCCTASHVHTLLLCCSVTYVYHTPKLAPPVLHQTRAAALCSTWQHNSQAHTCVVGGLCCPLFRPTSVKCHCHLYCADSTYILVTNIIFNNEVKHFQTEHVLGLSEVLAHVVESSLIGANGRPHPGQRAGCRL